MINNLLLLTENIVLDKTTLTILLSIAIATLVLCVLSAKDTWENIGNYVRKSVYIIISVVFLAVVAFLIYALATQFI